MIINSKSEIKNNIIIINANEPKPLDRAVYKQCEWILKDLERLRKISALEEKSLKKINSDYLLAETFLLEGKVGLISDNVFKEAGFKCSCIDDALLLVPEDMREALLNNIINHEDFPDVPGVNTWKKWKRRFMWALAKKLNLY